MKDLHSDLAVIEVEEMLPGIQPLAFGDINDVAVGQTVVAIGNPFGLGGSLTRGSGQRIGSEYTGLIEFLHSPIDPD